MIYIDQKTNTQYTVQLVIDYKNRILNSFGIFQNLMTGPCEFILENNESMNLYKKGTAISEVFKYVKKNIDLKRTVNLHRFGQC